MTDQVVTVAQGQKIDINLPDATRELILRHGEAAPIELPTRQTLSGNIFAPGEFLAKRQDSIPVQKSFLYVKRRALELVFVIDEREPRNTSIKGKLTVNADLKAFGINDPKRWPLKDLVNFLRMNRRKFNEVAVADDIIDKLGQFAAKVETEMKNTDDRKGHTLIMIEKKVSHDIPLAFTLKMPIYERDESIVFGVDIRPDISESSISFWLESVELVEELEERRDFILDREIAKFSAFVVIEE